MLPVARIFSLNAHDSKSKPCGFWLPCGRFKRTFSNQRSPALNKLILRSSGFYCLLVFSVLIYCIVIKANVAWHHGMFSQCFFNIKPKAHATLGHFWHTATTPSIAMVFCSQVCGNASLSRQRATLLAQLKPSINAANPRKKTFEYLLTDDCC